MKNFGSEKSKFSGMPMQAMPVERRLAGSAAMSGDAGADASGIWDWVKNAATTVAPIALQAAKAFL